ncbi:MAG: restriction endonuclease [Methanomicrobiales archaeon]|nr:restriction endonuclease [Methanomicrobiales archaeon]
MPPFPDRPKERSRWIPIRAILTAILFPPSILPWLIPGALRVREDPPGCDDRRLRCGIDTIDRMRGAGFEAYPGLLFQRCGYAVERTPNRGDFGADLILRKGREIIAVQARRYITSAGVAAVQEVAAARSHYGVERARVVTNSYFTKPACHLARSNRVIWWTATGSCG